MKISIKGRRSVTGEPVWIRTEELPAGCCSAVTEDGKRFPAQSKGDGVLVIADLDREKAVEAELSCQPAEGGVEVRFAEDRKALDIRIGGKLFTSYVFGRGFLKPYLGPVYTAAGTTYTRLDLETKEHPHQRSVFLAVGDVNGIDFWNENEETRGEQRHQAIESMTSGPAWGGFTANNVWCDHKGNHPAQRHPPQGFLAEAPVFQFGVGLDGSGMGAFFSPEIEQVAALLHQLPARLIAQLQILRPAVLVLAPDALPAG